MMRLALLLAITTLPACRGPTRTSDPTSTPSPASEAPEEAAIKEHDAFTGLTVEMNRGIVIGDNDLMEVRDPAAPAPVPDDVLRSVVAIVEDTHLECVGDECRVSHEVTPLAQTGDQPLCDEGFLGQPQLVTCGGALVSENLVVTAGHCINQLGCGPGTSSEHYFVFDVLLDPEDRAPKTFPATSVYRGRVVDCHYERTEEDGADWALVELVGVDGRAPIDRPAVTRATQSLEEGSPIYYLGFPLGLPMKHVGGATVKRVRDDEPLARADLDTFVHSSGSPVLNKDHELVGVVTSIKCGVPPFTTDDSQQPPCARAKRRASVDPQCSTCPQLQRTSLLEEKIARYENR